MREIKFRVWSNQLNKMVYPDERGWFEKCFLHENGHLQTCQLGLAVSMNGKELELMQYTGFQDEKGTQIHEGDIVKAYLQTGYEYDSEKDAVVHSFEEVIAECVFSEVVGGFYLVHKNSYYFIPDVCQVIGNVFEHKHLLEVEES